MPDTEKVLWENPLERPRKSKQRRLIARWCWVALKPALSATTLVLAIYAGMFCSRFELLGLPVIDRERGWLGPTIRHDQHTQDVGGVGYYESSDYQTYDFYSPLCHAWIWANGLPYGEFRT